MRILKILFFLCFASVLYSCMSKTTNDPEKAFRRWTGINQKNTEVNVLHGQYWRSGHFTLEYEATFKMVASKEWVNQLIEFNSLKLWDKQFSPHFIHGNTPDWFAPTANYNIYRPDGGYKLFLWINPVSDTIYIFNQQL